MGRLKGVGSRRHLTSGDACRSKSQKRRVLPVRKFRAQASKKAVETKMGRGRGIQANAVDRFREDLLLARERYMKEGFLWATSRAADRYDTVIL